MIVELVMHRMGWTHVWYADPGPFLGPSALLRNAYGAVWPGRFAVGVWTGPQNDLLCLKRCATNAEAERYLSPAGPTVLAACVAALWKSARAGMQLGRGKIVVR